MQCLKNAPAYFATAVSYALSEMIFHKNVERKLNIIKMFAI
jgi:hypothetical protein